MSTSAIGASTSVRAEVPAYEPNGIVPVRRLGEDRRNRNVWWYRLSRRKAW
jgi:hypothetical protein